MRPTQEQAAEMRALFMRALRDINPLHPAINGFHAAFDKRLSVTWLEEALARTRENAIHQAFGYLLFYVARKHIEPTDGCPDTSDVSPDFWQDVVRACETIPEHLLNGVIVRMHYEEVDSITSEKLGEEIIHGMLVYGNRTRNGLGMSPDPW